jgi:hypothetical protein
LLSCKNLLIAEILLGHFCKYKLNRLELQMPV